MMERKPLYCQHSRERAGQNQVTLDPMERDILLPCQWKYWHRAKNRLRDKTGFGMYNPQNVEKSGFGQSVCVCVCLSVCLSGRLSVLLSLCPRALTGVRFNRSS